jgi:hypothetical protein
VLEGDELVLRASKNPQQVLIMAEPAALFALFPATAYLLLIELLKKHR